MSETRDATRKVEQTRRTRPRRAMLIGVALSLVLLEVVFPVVLFLARNSLLFHPRREPPPATALESPGIRDWVHLVRVERPDGRRLAAYDAVLPGRSGEDPVVLYLHGNAGNIADRARRVQSLAQGLGARVLMPDYSGYGGNEGAPSEAEVTLDGVAAFDHLVDRGVPPERIVIFGQSLGGAVALAVAEQRACAGVAVQSTFASLSSMARRVYPWLPALPLLARGRFPSDRRAAALAVPLLIVHGDADRVIPFEEGRALHAATAESAEFLAVPGAGHDDLFTVGGEDYMARLRDLFHRWAASTGR